MAPRIDRVSCRIGVPSLEHRKDGSLPEKSPYDMGARTMCSSTKDTLGMLTFSLPSDIR